MKKTPYRIHPWKIIEEDFDPARSEISESIFSLGNGYMGHRANFEEDFSGKSLQGTYIGGIYYPDKTRVGWWKIGYPEYFAKVPNAPFWSGIRVIADGEVLDLNRVKILSFRRELDMKEDWLLRQFRVRFPSGKELEVTSFRYLHMKRKELGIIRYSVKPLNFDGEIRLISYIDGGIKNRDANYGEYFWNILDIQHSGNASGYVLSETKKTRFKVCTAAKHFLKNNDTHLHIKPSITVTDKRIDFEFVIPVKQGKETVLYKYVAVTHSRTLPEEAVIPQAEKILQDAVATGFDALLDEHKAAWKKIWETSDVEIHGDDAAQQGIRYNILQLNHTYTGEDPELNIGPKGFTGEKYGGSTYWDTEAFCFPFYLATKNEQVGRQLLLYRYRHLPKAIENAEKLGFSGGAALYPMVTVNGEECHNEWEITFEEIHRNGAMIYAIDYFKQFTGDDTYIRDYGLEVMIAVSRFWAQRVNWSEEKGKYVILGVTGPNEYENNVNNNWHTNYIARWTLDYTLKNLEEIKVKYPEDYYRITARTGLTEDELRLWQRIIGHLYLPEDPLRGIFLQQDGFFDKEIKPASMLPQDQLPLNQHWSWDRILRSCYIKQADVLQGLYFFENHFDKDTIRRNFDFYEPLTVHESSLSPSVHGVLAASLGKLDKAYEMFMPRLDLDDYNKEAAEGLHITSMAGTWLVISRGFGGMREKDGKLSFRPVMPPQWESYSFMVRHKDALLKIYKDRYVTRVENLSDKPAEIILYGQACNLQPGAKTEMIDNPSA